MGENEVQIKVRARRDPEVAGDFIEHELSAFTGRSTALQDLKEAFVRKHKADYAKAYHVACVRFEVLSRRGKARQVDDERSSTTNVR